MDTSLLDGLVAAGLIDRETAERMRRQLDPVALRQWADDLLYASTLGALGAQQARYLGLLRATGEAPTAGALGEFWSAENERLHRSLSASLRVIADEGAASVAWRSAMGDEAAQLQLEVVRWVDRHYLDTNPNTLGSVYQLNRTGQAEVAQAFGRWKRGELRDLVDGESPLAPLIDALQPAFGAGRAERIASTEVTRIFAEANQQAAMRNPDVTGFLLLTAADERVCPICGPLHRQRRPKDGEYIHPTLGALGRPPFHVRCRCDETPVTLASALAPRPAVDVYQFSGQLPEPTQ